MWRRKMKRVEGKEIVDKIFNRMMELEERIDFQDFILGRTSLMDLLNHPVNGDNSNVLETIGKLADDLQFNIPAFLTEKMGFFVGRTWRYIASPTSLSPALGFLEKELRRRFFRRINVNVNRKTESAPKTE